MLFKKNNKGFILITSYMVIVVLIILGVAFIAKSITEVNLTRRKQSFIQAIYLAEGGVDYALTQLRAGTSQGDPAATTLAEIGDYDCAWSPKAGFPNRWQISSKGIVGDIEREVYVEVQLDTFARYLYFTDDEHFRWYGWRIPVWFITDDYLGGPLQTNGHMHISGDPVFSDPNFHKPVKSADDFIEYMHGGPPSDNPDFQEGIQLGAEVLPFPSKALDLRTAAVQNGYHFNASGSEPAQIFLNSDSTITVTDSTHQNENMPLPANGAIFVTGGNVEVSGTLSGQLSIGTNRSVVITDNIIYNDDPRINPDSADTLGLIAERDVVVSEGAPYDLEIDASILALGNSFTVEEWWEGPPKGTLTVYGGIIQDYRGPVGTFNSNTNTKLSGYSKNYQCDPRLGDTPPPFYPTTGDYVVLSWQEQ